MSQCTRKEFQLSTFQVNNLAQGQFRAFYTIPRRNWDPQVTFLAVLCFHCSAETLKRLSSMTVYASSGAADGKIEASG